MILPLVFLLFVVGSDSMFSGTFTVRRNHVSAWRFSGASKIAGHVDKNVSTMYFSVDENSFFHLGFMDKQSACCDETRISSGGCGRYSQIYSSLAKKVGATIDFETVGGGRNVYVIIGNCGEGSVDQELALRILSDENSQNVTFLLVFYGLFGVFTFGSFVVYFGYFVIHFKHKIEKKSMVISIVLLVNLFDTLLFLFGVRTNESVVVKILSLVFSSLKSSLFAFFVLFYCFQMDTKMVVKLTFGVALYFFVNLIFYAFVLFDFMSNALVCLFLFLYTLLYQCNMFFFYNILQKLKEERNFWMFVGISFFSALLFVFGFCFVLINSDSADFIQMLKFINDFILLSMIGFFAFIKRPFYRTKSKSNGKGNGNTPHKNNDGDTDHQPFKPVSVKREITKLNSYTNVKL